MKYEDSFRIDVLQGMLALTWGGIGWMVHEFTPILAFIGALTGAILGIHGVLGLIKYKGKIKL